MVPGDIGWDAVEEADWEDGPDRLPMEGVGRAEGMVRVSYMHLSPFSLKELGADDLMP